MIDRAIERVRYALDAALPPYQLTAELHKLKAEIAAELEAGAPSATLDIEEVVEESALTLVERIEQVASNAQAYAIAKELGVEFPKGVKKIVDKVAWLREQAELAAGGPAEETVDEETVEEAPEGEPPADETPVE